MKPNNSFNLEVILKDLGELGCYQIQTYCLILLPIIFNAMYNSEYIFSAGETRYRCRVPECENNPPTFETKEWGLWALPQQGQQCHRNLPLGKECTSQNFAKNIVTCTAWIYENNNTIVSEFNLACKEWKRTLVGTIHNAGVFVALPLTAYISESFGRRPAFTLTAISVGVIGFIKSFCQSYIAYVVLEFLESTFGSGAYSTGFILALELVGTNYRVLGGNLISSTFAVGQVCVALIAWAFPYWRTLLSIIYIPSMFFFVYYFFIEESVKWLLIRGKKKDVVRILNKAAAKNKRTLTAGSIKMLADYETNELEGDRGKLIQSGPIAKRKEKSIFTQIILSKLLMSRLLICSFWWSAVTFIYYGLSINSVSLAGNRYVNYILTSLVEIPGYFVSILTLDRFGRKTPIMTAFFVCGFALFALPFLPENIAIVLTMVGKLCISMIFGSIYIYTIELFPTHGRHSLMGTCSMVGRIGSMMAPQTPLLMQYMKSLPYLIFAVMAICSGFLLMLTPETLKISLPDTVHQAENIAMAPKPTRQNNETGVD